MCLCVCVCACVRACVCACVCICTGQLPRTRRKAGVVMEFDEVSEFQSMLASGYRESLALTSVYPLNDNLEPVSPLLVKPRLLATRKVKKRVSQVRRFEQ